MKTTREPALILPQSVYDAMLNQVSACLTEEMCGLVAGRATTATLVIPVENQYHALDIFQMNPQAQIDAFNWIEKENLDLLGIYHSHPKGPAHPSQTDLEEFAYPGVTAIIWSLQNSSEWQMKVFSITDRQTAEIPWHIL